MNETADKNDSPQRRSLAAKFLRPSWDERKRMLRIEAWVFVIAAYLLLAFAYLWPPAYERQSPIYVTVAWTAFMIRIFVFHLGLVLLIIAAIASYARRWRLTASVVPLLVITIGPTCRDFLPKAKPTIQGEHVKVMSVNLLMINQNTGPIIEEIKRANPEVLLLQEYTDHWHEALQSAIGKEYPHTAFERRDDSFGTAVYSRRPFEGPVQMSVPLGQGGEPQVRAVIRVNDRPVAFYNIHLLPPWGMEYTIENRREFADLLKVLSAERLPLVLAGDFNFTESTPNASELERLGLREAHRLGGWGRGTTWPVNSFFRWIPSLRLDHVYLSKELTCSMCRTGIGVGSDHRPVITVIGFGQ